MCNHQALAKTNGTRRQQWWQQRLQGTLTCATRVFSVHVASAAAASAAASIAKRGRELISAGHVPSGAAFAGRLVACVNICSNKYSLLTAARNIADNMNLL